MQHTTDALAAMMMLAMRSAVDSRIPGLGRRLGLSLLGWGGALSRPDVAMAREGGTSSVGRHRSSSSSRFSLCDAVPPRDKAGHAIEVQEAAGDKGPTKPPGTGKEARQDGEEQSGERPDTDPPEVVFCLIIDRPHSYWHPRPGVAARGASQPVLWWRFPTVRCPAQQVTVWSGRPRAG